MHSYQCDGCKRVAIIPREDVAASITSERQWPGSYLDGWIGPDGWVGAGPLFEGVESPLRLIHFCSIGCMVAALVPVACRIDALLAEHAPHARTPKVTKPVNPVATAP